MSDSTPADAASQGGNLLCNPGFEQNWGWVYYGGADVRLDATVAHSGQSSALVTPGDGGMKRQPWDTVEVGERLEIWGWVRAAPGATATVNCALFSGPDRWLRRHLRVGESSANDWALVTRIVTRKHPEMTHLDLEVAVQGKPVWVGDFGIRKLTP